MTPEQGEAYDALIRKEVSNHSIDAWGSEDQMERAMKFFQKPRQMCNMVVTGGVTHRPKIDALVSNVVDSVSRGKKCLVYSQYLDAGINEIESMLRMTKIHFVKIVGDINAVKKNEAKCAFNSGKARILLISRSGSEGLDLKETDEVHLLEPHWNPAVTNQVIGRAVRYKSHEDDRAVVKIFHYYAEKCSPSHKVPKNKNKKDGSENRKSQFSIKPNLNTESFDNILWHINWIKSVTTAAFVKQVIVPSSIERNSSKYSLPDEPEPPIKPNKHKSKDTKVSKTRFRGVAKFEIPFFLK
jgi:ERCC4-related helicase